MSGFFLTTATIQMLTKKFIEQVSVQKKREG